MNRSLDLDINVLRPWQHALTEPTTTGSADSCLWPAGRKDLQSVQTEQPKEKQRDLFGCLVLPRILDSHPDVLRFPALETHATTTHFFLPCQFGWSNSEFMSTPGSGSLVWLENLPIVEDAK